MFSRFRTLCHKRVDICVYNLRTYRISSTLSQQQDAVEQETIVPEKREREPLIICKRPEFNFYKGKTFSKFETIPLASKGWHHAKSCGDYFTILPDYKDNEGEREIYERQPDFENFDLHPKLIENLEAMNIHAPTEIQYLGIPRIMLEQHTVLSAETGCGKTLAYLLPLLNQIYKWKRLEINQDRPPNQPFGLIITPSRELAEQIGREAKWLAKDLGIRISVKTGGRTKKITSNPPVGEIDLLIGSFGVISKLTTTKIFRLNYVRHLVLDEAHALFDVTFDEKLEIFLRRLNFNEGDMASEYGFPNYCQMTLVSATKASDLPEYMGGIISEKLLSDVTTDNFHRVMVPQKFLRVKGCDKSMTLLKLVKPRAVKKIPFIVFSNDSSTSNWLSLFLNEFGIHACHLNGEMTMAARMGKFAAFQNGEFSVLSATNAGARGLDTVHVNNIINYDFPLSTADYIHRCGRTGRLGVRGECRVTNLISRHLEIELTQTIERAARRRRPLPIFDLIEEKAKRAEAAEDRALLGPKNRRKTSPKNGKDVKKKKTRKRTQKTETKDVEEDAA